MANRMLTRDQVASLFKAYTNDALVIHKDGSEVTVYHVDSDNREKFGVQDLILSDVDFINNRVRVLLRQWGAKFLNPQITETPDASDQILSTRGFTHGDYLEMSAVIQAIKTVMHGASMWNRMHSAQQESLDLTATKIGRIVCGDPMYLDHWDDIIGYNKLARDATAKVTKKD